MALIQVQRSVHGTLGVDVVTIQFLEYVANFRVKNRGTSNLYVRVDNIDPIAEGDGTIHLAPGETRVVQVPDTLNPEIRLVSPALSLAYSVEKDQ